MSFEAKAVIRGKQVTKPCPVCDEQMTKVEYLGIGWCWQCQNDDCGHREEP
jgi:ribosomal protein L37AE/L43A